MSLSQTSKSLYNNARSDMEFFSSKYLTIDAECAAPLLTLVSAHRNLRSASLTGEHDFSLWNSLFKWIFRRVILLENTNKPARRIFDGQFCGLVSISFWHQLSDIAPRGGLSQSPILHASSALVTPPWVTVETRSTMAAGASFMPPRIHSSVSPTKAYL